MKEKLLQVIHLLIPFAKLFYGFKSPILKCSFKQADGAVLGTLEWRKPAVCSVLQIPPSPGFGVG